MRPVVLIGGKLTQVFGTYRLAFLALICLVTIEACAAAIIGSRILGLTAGSIFKIGDLRTSLAGWFFIPLLWLGAASITLAKRRTQRPSKKLIRLVRLKKSWLLRGVVLCALLVPFARSFTAVKTAIPSIHPYSFDPFFANMDRFIFGTDPWMISHWLIGYSGTIILDRLYFLWATYLLLLAGWINFTRNEYIQIRTAITFNLCWFVLGGAFAILFSSTGPVFYDRFYGDPRFEPLVVNLQRVHENETLFALNGAAYLLKNIGSVKLGAGISAMPSLHVSMAFLGVIVAFHEQWPAWLKALLVVFFATILVGSVHLGWHYVVDGVFSIIGTLIIWSSVGAFLRFIDDVNSTLDSSAGLSSSARATISPSASA